MPLKYIIRNEIAQRSNMEQNHNDNNKTKIKTKTKKKTTSKNLKKSNNIHNRERRIHFLMKIFCFFLSTTTRRRISFIFFCLIVIIVLFIQHRKYFIDIIPDMVTNSSIDQPTVNSFDFSSSITTTTTTTTTTTKTKEEAKDIEEQQQQLDKEQRQPNIDTTINNTMTKVARQKQKRKQKRLQERKQKRQHKRETKNRKKREKTDDDDNVVVSNNTLIINNSKMMIAPIENAKKQQQKRQYTKEEKKKKKRKKKNNDDDVIINKKLINNTKMMISINNALLYYCNGECGTWNDITKEDLDNVLSTPLNIGQPFVMTCGKQISWKTLTSVVPSESSVSELNKIIKWYNEVQNWCKIAGYSTTIPIPMINDQTNNITRTREFIRIEDDRKAALLLDDEKTTTNNSSIKQQKSIVIRWGDSYVSDHITYPVLNKARRLCSRSRSITNTTNSSTSSSNILNEQNDTLKYDNHRDNDNNSNRNTIIGPFNYNRHFEKIQMTKKSYIPWNEKEKNCLIWRGASTGWLRFYYVKTLTDLGYDVKFTKLTHENLQENIRYLKNKASIINNDDTGDDVGSAIDNNNHHHHHHHHHNHNNLNLTNYYNTTKLTKYDMMKCRYVLSLEGNDVATNLKWLLAHNSVIIMPIPKYEIWSMEGLLRPYIHYIPISNPNNISSIINELNTNETKSLQIIQNANEFVTQFINKERNEQLISKLIQNSSEWFTRQLILHNISRMI